MYEFDANLVYMELGQAQKFFEMGQGVSGIEVNLADIYSAPKIGFRIESILGTPFWTRTWKEMYRNLFSALKLEKIAMFVILTFIVLVAAFNIIIALIMLVMEKSRDIAILKALGATSDRIMRIFVGTGNVGWRRRNPAGCCGRNCRSGCPGPISHYRITRRDLHDPHAPYFIRSNGYCYYMRSRFRYLFFGHNLSVTAGRQTGARGGA